MIRVRPYGRAGRFTDDVEVHAKMERRFGIGPFD